MRGGKAVIVGRGYARDERCREGRRGRSPDLRQTERHAMNAPSPNFRQSELDTFAALANRWWDPKGPQKALHALNPVRLGYVAAPTAPRGAKVLDVGCGGALLSEALGRAGPEGSAARRVGQKWEGNC